MRHYGDICKLSGYTLPVVDCITGGSPCQDLSVAGKRAGLDGERSGLFMEQVRIVKEMRENDRRNGRTGEFVRPRYMVWENVPGAFSSNGGKDFQAVLTEIVKIANPGAPDVPMPESGRWPKAGCFYDEMGRWSIAYRVHDAQYWGVPQRRKRIALLADFNGLSAPEILFDPQLRGETEGAEPYETVSDIGAEPPSEIQSFGESLPGDFEQSGTQREGTAAGTESRVDSAICLQGNGIDRADTAGCNGAGWRRGGVTPLTQSTGPQLSPSKNALESPEEAREYSSRMSEQAPCQLSITSPYTIPINTMVGTRDAAETRTTFGVGEPGDPQFTISAAHEHAVFSAGFSFGQSEKARSIGYQAEMSPTLRGGEGGNQKPVVMAIDVYNQTVDGDVAASITTATGGANTSGPKLLCR